MSTGVATFRYVQKISDLTDVTIATTPTNGQVLKYENGVWVPGTDQAGQIPSVGQLTNTNAVTDAPTADRHALVWNTGANEWISEQVDYNNLANQPNTNPVAFHALGAGQTNVNVSVDTATANQVLKYVGGEWVNAQVDYSEILNPPVIPPPANPIDFHTLGEGQTDVATTVSTAPVNDNLITYTGGAWNQVPFDSWTPKVHRDINLNSDWNFSIVDTVTPVQGQIGINLGADPQSSLITDIYLQNVQYGKNYQFIWNDSSIKVGDIINLVGTSTSVDARMVKGVYKITAMVLTGGIVYTRFTVKYLRGFGNYETGVASKAGISFETNDQAFASSASLQSFAFGGTQAVGANLDSDTVLSVVVGHVKGDFATTGNAWELQYTGPDKQFRFDISSLAVADQVDRTFDFYVSVNNALSIVYVKNTSKTNTVAGGGENTSSASAVLTLTTGQTVSVRYRLNDTNLPKPNNINIQSCTLMINEI